MNNIGKKLLAARKSQWRSQEEVALSAEYGAKSLSDAELGKCALRLSNAARLCDVLGISLDWLTDRKQAESLNEKMAERYMERHL